MNSDTTAIIGTIIGTGVALGVGLGTLVFMQIASVSTRVDDLRISMSSSIGGVQTATDTRVVDLQTAVNNSVDGLQAAVDSRINDLQGVTTNNVNALQAAMTNSVDDLQTAVTGSVDTVRDEIVHLRTALSSFDDRLRNVEVSFGQVDQRLIARPAATRPASCQARVPAGLERRRPSQRPAALRERCRRKSARAQ